MNSRRLILIVLLMIMLCLAASHSVAQTPTPLPSPTPNISDSQEKVRVFTEEVVIPVTAYDDSGHLSAALNRKTSWCLRMTCGKQ